MRPYVQHTSRSENEENMSAWLRLRGELRGSEGPEGSGGRECSGVLERDPLHPQRDGGGLGLLLPLGCRPRAAWEGSRGGGWGAAQGVACGKAVQAGRLGARTPAPAPAPPGHCIQSVARLPRCQVLVMSPPGALCTSLYRSMFRSPSSSLRLRRCRCRSAGARAVGRGRGRLVGRSPRGGGHQPGPGAARGSRPY